MYLNGRKLHSERAILSHGPLTGDYCYSTPQKPISASEKNLSLVWIQLLRAVANQCKSLVEEKGLINLWPEKLQKEHEIVMSQLVH